MGSSVLRPSLAAASIWFEIWGVVDPGQKILIFEENLGKVLNFFRQLDKQKIDFSIQIFEEFRFFRQFQKNFDFLKNCRKISIFSGNFRNRKSIFQGQFQKNFY